MTVGELILLLQKYPKNVNIDIADKGIYSNIKGLSYSKWTDRELHEYETYSIIPIEYKKEDALISKQDEMAETKEAIKPNYTVDEICGKIEYWFRNVGPFVFPEDNDTLRDLLNYIKN